MSGLYIHIPFCDEKCFYCDFYSGNLLYLIDSYVDALIKELKIRSNYLPDNEIDTIYFGGGTPSLLSIKHIDKIFQAINLNFKIGVKPEITIECNPENISINYVNEIFRLGINRISLGVQFLDNKVLNKYNRKHSKEIIFNALNIISNSKFINISVDLIYSVPEISDEVLLLSLIQLINYDIKHFSTYCLTVSKNSKLYWKIQSGEIKESDENMFFSQYKIISDFLKEKGYIQYEISNYAKVGFFSEHNLAYWNQIPYLGLGVSAHSYNLSSRQWNHLNIKKYIRDLNKDLISFELEQLSDNQKYNEYIILRLRTYQGLSYDYVRNFFNSQFFHFVLKIKELKERGHFIFKDDLIIPKESDLLIADYLSKILMF